MQSCRGLWRSPPLRVGGQPISPDASASPSRTNQYALITRLQQPRHFTHKAFRLRHWREARSHDASLVNQELREVPFYAVAQQPALLLPKPNVEGVGVLAVDLDVRPCLSGDLLCNHGEGHQLAGLRTRWIARTIRLDDDRNALLFPRFLRGTRRGWQLQYGRALTFA
jgi:hypothetical protein